MCHKLLLNFSNSRHLCTMRCVNLCTFFITKDIPHLHELLPHVHDMCILPCLAHLHLACEVFTGSVSPLTLEGHQPEPVRGEFLAERFP